MGAPSVPLDDPPTRCPARTLSHTYTMGFLSAVPSYASSITYHPNLMVKRAVDANAVIWTQQIADGQSGRPNDAVARPYSIAISGAATSWSLGPYAYDGAGNIKQIGTTSPYETYVYDKVLRLATATLVTEGEPDATQRVGARPRSWTRRRGDDTMRASKGEVPWPRSPSASSTG